ncbi:hypothetical protein TRFO_36070 [Tritrichomonas foetus]|uniref:Myb-like DNA-binding domain containing protein n=1 Tax=Tritrichomonas foetus TaxID=1144522 RepID=A0A1J4JF22_9EUKA|nr:hypothetical protein TRFO_36070 [Tritrichomonas foetus]|eukprot:OHS97696.1 hypothetical protein TRFO_36070 [Tritrichomonas foetus]
MEIHKSPILPYPSNLAHTNMDKRLDSSCPQPILTSILSHSKYSQSQIISSKNDQKTIFPNSNNQLKIEQPKKAHPKSKFGVDEDMKLRSLVAQFGENNWPQVAANMPNRNTRQCKERWCNYLAPGIRKTPWTTEEDELLLEKVREIGARWVQIAKFFPMRTDISIKNRFLVLERRNKKEMARSGELNHSSNSNVLNPNDGLPQNISNETYNLAEQTNHFSPSKINDFLETINPLNQSDLKHLFNSHHRMNNNEIIVNNQNDSIGYNNGQNILNNRNSEIGYNNNSTCNQNLLENRNDRINYSNTGVNCNVGRIINNNSNSTVYSKYTKYSNYCNTYNEQSSDNSDNSEEKLYFPPVYLLPPKKAILAIQTRTLLHQPPDKATPVIPSRFIRV